MPLVNAKCTNCGATLTVDDKGEAAICEHCGSAFIVQKAIANYISNINISSSTTINSTNTVIIDSEKQRAEEKIAFDVENAIKNEYFKARDYKHDCQGTILNEIRNYLENFPAEEFGYQHYIAWETNCFPYLYPHEISSHVTDLKKVMADYKNVKNAKTFKELENVVNALLKQTKSSYEKKKEADDKKAAGINELTETFRNKVQMEEKNNAQLRKELDNVKATVVDFSSSPFKFIGPMLLGILAMFIGAAIGLFSQKRIPGYIIMGIGIIFTFGMLAKNCVKIFSSKNKFTLKTHQLKESDENLIKYKNELNEYENQLKEAFSHVKEDNACLYALSDY